MSNDDKTESDFKLILGAPLIYALTANSRFITHKVYTDMHTRYGKRIDTIFLPLKNKKTTVIIHEYKKVDGMNKLDEILENAFWQIYVNFYISEALLKKEEHADAWNTIIIRAIVLFRRIDSTWGVKIKEAQHTFEQALDLERIFIIDDDVRKNSEALICDKLAARVEFIESYHVNSLDELIRSNSIDNKITILTSAEVTIIDEDLDIPKKYSKRESKSGNIERQVSTTAKLDIPKKRRKHKEESDSEEH